MSISTWRFGRTEHLSTRCLFGAAALANVTQDEADRTLDLLLEYGINHIDTAASYGDSELRIGPWMAAYRDQFFLATKTGERTYEGAKAEFERSLDAAARFETRPSDAEMQSVVAEWGMEALFT